MIVLVDMDGVLCDLQTSFRNKYKELYGVELGVPEHFYFEKAYGDEVTPDKVDRILREKGFFLDLEPMAGAVEAMKVLGNCTDTYICTAPQTTPHCMGEKIDWIGTYLGQEWIKRVICSKDKTVIMGDILIDDEPEKTGILEPSWLHVLYSHRFNEHLSKPRITWDDWPKIFQYAKQDT
jgi:5'-nucleotidase